MPLPRRISKISSLLDNRYKSPNLGNKKNPLNELLYIIISLRTTDSSTQRTYARFKIKFPSWNIAYAAKTNKIAAVLKNAGLFRQKARNLKLILTKVKQDWKTISLRKLKSLDTGSLERYLLSLPGIGTKSARCIMMYSFNRKVFPVDSHCFRIIKRLGWIDQDSKYTVRIQDKIQQLIPPRNRYKLHVNLIQHGRNICFPSRPRCKVCFLVKVCNYCKFNM